MASSSDATDAKCPFSGASAASGPNPHASAASVAPVATSPNALPLAKQDSAEERNRLSEITRKTKLHRFNSPLYSDDYLSLDILLGGVQPRSRELGCEAHERAFVYRHSSGEAELDLCINII